MSHAFVREAVDRLGAGSLPASGQIDEGLALVGFRQLFRESITNYYAHQRLSVEVFPDVRQAVLGVKHERSTNWSMPPAPTRIGGELGAERDQAMTEARTALEGAVHPQHDRAALNLAQRFRNHTRAKFSGSWQHGSQSWILVSELLPELTAFAVGLDIASVPMHDKLKDDAAREMALGAQVLALAGVWAFRIDCNYEIACVPCPSINANNVDEIHSDNGPAVQWPDAQEIWAFNGQPVPRSWILKPEEITPDRMERSRSLAEAEVMLNLYGMGRYIEERGSVADQDETGKLWACDHPWQSRAQWGATHVWIRAVEVVNSTPEPDGTSRIYWLRVPPHIRRAREGVAWTFDVPEREYYPAVET